MSQEESTDERLNQDLPIQLFSFHHSVKDIKWLDLHLCRILFPTNAEKNPRYFHLARHYYNDVEESFRDFASRVIPADAQVPICCLITTPYRCMRTSSCGMKRYRCNLPVMDSAFSTRLFLDLSTDVPNFSNQWDPFFRTTGGIVLDMFEWPEEGEEGGERVQPSDYDCVILYLDYPDLEHRDCGHLNAIADVFTSKQILVVTGSMWQASDLRPNLDCMQKMFEAVGGFRFPPFSNSWNHFRICCNRRQNKGTINLVEMVQWACLHTIRRRRRALHA